MNYPSEHQEQCTVIQYCTLKKILVFSIPNANAMSSLNKNMAVRIMSRLKKEGLKKGIPDLFIPVPKGIWCGMFIEMKRQKGSTTSKEQKEWIATLQMQGYRAVICKGAKEAISEIDRYLKGDYMKWFIYDEKFKKVSEGFETKKKAKIELISNSVYESGYYSILPDIDTKSNNTPKNSQKIFKLQNKANGCYIRWPSTK